MIDLVIFGTGGFAREVHELVEDINDLKPAFRCVGFLDGNAERHGAKVHGLPVLGDASWLSQHPETAVVVAIGNTSVRRKIVREIESLGHTSFATLVHPRATVGRRVEVGAGSIVCAGALITTDIELGEHVIINIGVTVGHDCKLETFVTVAPSCNISGNVHIGEGTDMGTNSTVIQGLQIGSWSVVGAGAVVVRALPANVTAVGTPAKPIKEREAGWHLIV